MPRFAPIGAAFALVSGMVGTGGPILAPFYVASGLVRGAFIGTEAAGTAIMHVVKLGAYGAGGVLSGRAVVIGLLLGHQDTPPAKPQRVCPPIRRSRNDAC